MEENIERRERRAMYRREDWAGGGGEEKGRHIALFLTKYAEPCMFRVLNNLQAGNSVDNKCNLASIEHLPGYVFLQ